MRKITTLASALVVAGLGFTANADFSGTPVYTGVGNVVNNMYAGSANTLTIEFDEEITEIVDGSGIEIICPNGSTVNSSYGWLGEMNDEWGDIESSNYASFRLPIVEYDLEFNAIIDPGVYTVSIPAGLVSNGSEENEALDYITFTVVDVYLDQDDMILSVPAGQYSADELGNILMSWEGYPFDGNQMFIPATATLATASEGGPRRAAGEQTIVDIRSYVELTDDGEIAMDLSNLEDGTWTIDLGAGIVYGTLANEENFTCKGIQLVYTISNTYPSMDEYTLGDGLEDEQQLTGFQQFEVSFSGQEVTVVEGKQAVVNINGEDYFVTPRVDYSSWRNSYTLVVNFGDEMAELDYPVGIYTITIPAGTVVNKAGEENPEITRTYRLYETTRDFVSNPNGVISYGEEVPYVKPADFKTITLTYTDFTKVEPNTEAWENIMVEYGLNEDGYSYDHYFYLTQNDVTFNGNVVTLNIPSASITENKYYITIPMLEFIIDDNYTNSTIALQYNVWSGMNLGEVIMAPAQISGPNVGNVMVTWDYTDLSVGSNGLQAVVYWGYPEWNDDYFTYGGQIIVPGEAMQLVYVNPNQEGGDIEPQADNAPNTLFVDLSSFLTAQPEPAMRLIIPANTVKNADGEANPEQTIEFAMYDYADNVKAICEDTDEPGVLNLLWEGDYDYYNVNNYGNEPFLVLADGDRIEFEQDFGWGYFIPEPGHFADCYDYGWDDNDDYYEMYAFLFNLNDLGLEEGEYDFVIQEGFFSFTFDLGNDEWREYINRETYVKVLVSEDGDIETSVEAISNLANDGVYRVYNLQGVKVLETTDSAALRNLKGMYIVNGRKMVVK